jgi:hypothetical protein
MKDIFDLGTVLLLKRAMQGQYLSAGQLMSPAEVITVSRESESPSDVMTNDWCLSGRLHPKMFALAKTTGLGQYWAQSLHVPGGYSYLVFMQRMDDWEHRFLVPLVGLEIRQFVSGKTHQALLMILADGNTGRSLAYTCGGRGQPILPAGLLVTDLPKDLPGLSVEIQRVTALLLNPAAVAEPLGLAPARHACLTLILSGELLAVMESAFECEEAGLRTE